jgi:hypothetical protein
MVSMPCGLELRNQCIDRVGFVVELQAGHAGRRHDGRRAFERHADEGHLVAEEVLHAVGGEHGGAGGGVMHVGGQETELRAGELAALQVFVHAQTRIRVGRVVAAVLHAQQFVLAFVELMVADRIEVDADAVHRLDRRLVLEQAEVSGLAPIMSPADTTACSGFCAFNSLMRVEKRVTPGLLPEPSNGLDVAVEVVEGDQLHLERGADLRSARCREQAGALEGADPARLLQRHGHGRYMGDEGSLVAPRILVPDLAVDARAVGVQYAIGHAGIGAAEQHVFGEGAGCAGE